MKEKNLKVMHTNIYILNAGLDVCRIFNEKAISLILQYGILEKVAI